MVPLSTALNTEKAAYVLEDSGAKLLVASAGVKAAAEMIAARLPAGVTLVYAIDGLADLPLWAEAIAAFPAEPAADLVHPSQRHEQAGGRIARLARIHHQAMHRRRHCRADVGIVEDDRRRLGTWCLRDQQ